MKNKSIIVTVIVSLIVGAGGFFAGMQYQKSQRPNFMMGQFNGQVRSFGQGGQTGSKGMMGGIRPIAGEIISSDEKSIIVKLSDGGSKIVLVSDKTAINKSSTGNLADLKTGEKIAAFGTENSDGSVTAQNIQLNPQMRIFNNSK